MEKPYQETQNKPNNTALLMILLKIAKSADEVDFTEGKNCIYKMIAQSEVMPNDKEEPEEEIYNNDFKKPYNIDGNDTITEVAESLEHTHSRVGSVMRVSVNKTNSFEQSVGARSINVFNNTPL